jgi:cell division protein ZipA
MNWSLVLNVLLLIGVVIAILRTLKMRRQDATVSTNSLRPSAQQQPEPTFDEIVSVRKLNDIVSEPSSHLKPTLTPTVRESLSPKFCAESGINPTPTIYQQPIERPKPVDVITTQSEDNDISPLMMFLLAKPNRQLAGYELLQAVLSAGFRFGEGDLFHRHQYPNGQGAVMCSLAAATPTGVFDLQNIGGFMVRGLCLFMHVSGETAVDEERFDIMMDTAKTLSDALDAHLLDDQRQPLSELSITRYHQRLSFVEALFE